METKKGLMIEGTIWKQLLLFSIPLLLGNLFQQLYNTVDSIIVGNYIGANALAAVGSSTPIVNLLVSFFSGLSTGAGVIIARYYGARDIEKMRKGIHTTLTIAIIGGISLSILGVLISPFILKWCDVPTSIFAHSVLYLQIYFGGIFSLVIYNMGAGILRAVGDSKTPLYFLIASSLVNIGLDLVFVVLLNMGIAGVAWATLIAQSISATLILLMLNRTKEEYHFNFHELGINIPLLKEIFRLGLPSGIQAGIISFSNLIVQANINAFGPKAMAGCSSYTKIDGFAVLPIMSFSMAITTFTGQNMGAKRFDRVKEGARTCLIISLATTAVIACGMFLLAPQLIQIFNRDPEVVYYGQYMMRTLVFGYFFLAISHCLAGVVRGAGISIVPMIIMVINWCFLRVAWINFAMPFFHDIIIVFLGYPLTWLGSAICLMVYYRKANIFSKIKYE